MAVITGLAVASATLEGVNYASVCKDFTITPTNQTDDGSGCNARWEDPVVVKSSWTGSGNFMADDALSSLAAKCVSNDVEITVSVDTGADVYTGNAILESVGHSFRDKGIQMRAVQMKGKGALTVS